MALARPDSLAADAPALREALAAWCHGREARAAEAALHAESVPAARSRGIFDLVRDRHLDARGVYRQMCNGGWSIALPRMEADGWRGALAPVPVPVPGLGLGADNGYVFGDLLGLDPAGRAALEESGAIR